MFSFITGQPFDRVSGHLNWAAADTPGFRANTAFHLVAQSTSGISVSIEHTEPPVRVTPSWTKYIEGTLGYAKVVTGSPGEHGHVELQLTDDEAATVVNPNRQEASISISTTGLVEDFIAAIRKSDRSPFLPTFQDGLQSLQVLAAASKADREGNSAKVVY
jgi:predicted dehydrogenase